MKRRDIIIVYALIALVLIVIFLTIRNDIRFNDSREREAREIEQRDILSRERQDSLTTFLNEIVVRMDSIDANQKEYIETEKLNQKVVQKSLDQIKSTQRQLLKSTK